MYHALDWIQKRRKHLDPATSPCYNIVTDSSYCVKLFATRAIKLVANKRIISRINVLHDQVKRNNSISISWTPAHINSTDSLALGNGEADRLAARGCVAPHFMTQRRPLASPSRHQPAVPPHSRTRLPVRSRTSDTPVRSCPRRRPRPWRDPRLAPFDPSQPSPWRAFFRRLAKRFCPHTKPALPDHEYNGDLVGD